ncbi:MAG: 4'-phosphopantetheinyl transferase family protein [Solirubrobacteraceae bacterium]
MSGRDQRVIGAAPARLPVIPGGPEVWLLDAAPAGLDQPGLRAWARAQAAPAGGSYSSRSYRFPYALVARHHQPVGVDIERVQPSDRAFLASISTPLELAEALDNTDLDEYVASLWCSKEALAKALGDALRYDPRRLRSPIDWPDGSAGRWRAAALPAPPHHVAWLCWRSATGDRTPA